MPIRIMGPFSVPNDITPEASTSSIHPSSPTNSGHSTDRVPLITACGIKRRDYSGTEQPRSKFIRASSSSHDDGASREDASPTSLGNCEAASLSREAEVFALQAIHTALLKKLSEVGPLLTELLSENKMYKGVLVEMGQSKDELQRKLELQCMAHRQLNPEDK
eukprot:scaffold650969_cov45-Prasinocladus_malaysianus.AAC.1